MYGTAHQTHFWVTEAKVSAQSGGTRAFDVIESALCDRRLLSSDSRVQYAHSKQTNV